LEEAMKRIVAGLVAIIAIAMPMGSRAAAPSVETVPIDVTFVPPALSATCGFAVTRHVEGRLTVRTFVDSSGAFARELDGYLLTETLTANGRTLTGRTTQVITVSALPDGTFTVAFMGTDFRLPVAGSGIAFGTVGRFVLLLAADGTIVGVTQDVGNATANTGAICAALA
jgi:hypothetical protein